jgi:hypothetical protein
MLRAGISVSGEADQTSIAGSRPGARASFESIEARR